LKILMMALMVASTQMASTFTNNLGFEMSVRDGGGSMMSFQVFLRLILPLTSTPSNQYLQCRTSNQMLQPQLDRHQDFLQSSPHCSWKSTTKSSSSRLILSRRKLEPHRHGRRSTTRITIVSFATFKRAIKTNPAYCFHFRDSRTISVAPAVISDADLSTAA
jgi:hypothetical protein